jgi:hypothetical protein
MNVRPNRIEQTTLDVPLLRADTPGVANVLHFNRNAKVPRSGPLPTRDT